MLQIIKQAKNYKWIQSLTCMPYLKNSPASPFLKDFYYDGIGLSPPVKITDTKGESYEH